MPGKKLVFALLDLLIFIGAAFPGAGVVRAALTLGNGYYTNLCDSGTNAIYYSCDKGCNPSAGTCTSSNSGAVKYVCARNWNQCLESESLWSNFEQMNDTGCGQTVQLSLFDKKCRRDDGTWDNSCRLLGYMVWYSGNCHPGISQPTPVPTVVSTPTNVPVQAVIQSQLANQMAALGSTTPQPTVTEGINICGNICNPETGCGAGFTCAGGVCRNPSCITDSSCFCKTGGGNVKPVVPGKKTPDTGAETWLGMAGMLWLGMTGIKLVKTANRIW